MGVLSVTEPTQELILGMYHIAVNIKSGDILTSQIIVIKEKKRRVGVLSGTEPTRELIPGMYHIPVQLTVQTKVTHWILVSKSTISDNQVQLQRGV